MKIPIATDYGVRILRHLHNHRDDTLTAMNISEATGITYPFFIKIASLLKRRGLLKAIHGRNGGYELGKPAYKISVYDVYVAIEKKDMQIHHCLKSGEPCDHGNFPDCKMRKFFSGIQENIIAEMSGTKITDLVS